MQGAHRAHVPDYAQRMDDLARLREALRARLDPFAAATSADFGQRSRHETLLADGMTVLSEIDHIRAHLRGWMRPDRVATSLMHWPGRNEVRKVPLGVVGVLSPWNYPINLALIPLVGAIGAGNHVLLKPSEHTPRTAALLQELIAEVFPAQRADVVLGDAGIAQKFAGLPFDHLFFTGSTAVGRKVMAAAAPNLTPVTLELGGKSPAFVSASCDLEEAARRIAQGKCFNAG
ncbi:MAG: aldehyde dehydrogenase family protein, partial [Lysobacterales bacterium]